VVVLPDIILDDASADPLRYNLAAMVARFNETGRSQVLAKRMEGDLRVLRYSDSRCTGISRADCTHR
jgi:UTP-glucose-1-phosphate uridylyltransferase